MVVYWNQQSQKWCHQILYEYYPLTVVQQSIPEHMTIRNKKIYFNMACKPRYYIMGQLHISPLTKHILCPLTHSFFDPNLGNNALRSSVEGRNQPELLPSPIYKPSLCSYNQVFYYRHPTTKIVLARQKVNFQRQG